MKKDNGLFETFKMPTFLCLADKVKYIQKELYKYGSPIRVSTDFGRTYERCTMDLLGIFHQRKDRTASAFYQELERMVNSNIELPLHVQSACYNPDHATPAVKYMR